jgi:hypothetical protein
MGEDVEEEVKLTKRKLQSNDGIWFYNLT